MRLQNIALIDSLDLDFEQGFTVLTGETGSGKSIIFDSIDLLLGGNNTFQPSLMHGDLSTKALIEASFLINSKLEAWLKKQSVDFEDSEELLITREWHLKQNRLTNRCRVNGVVVNKQQVLSIRPLLIELTVQGQVQFLASSSKHVEWLDRLGGASLDFALKKVKSSWQEWSKVSFSLEQFRLEREELQKKLNSSKDSLNELESYDLSDPREDLNLQKQQDRLANGVRLLEGFNHIFSLIKESTHDLPSSLDQLGMAINELHVMNTLDSSLKCHLDNAINLQLSLQELISQLEQYNLMLDTNPGVLEKIQERLSILKSLQRRYNLDLPGLINFRDELRASLDNEACYASFDELENREKLCRNQLDINNKSLTELRKSSAKTLEKKLMQQLHLLGLRNVRFQVEIHPSKYTENGADAVKFLFSANPGQPLLPLSDIASGGEMSRFLLALKTIVAEVDDSSTLLFDEIDVGVSGRVSSAIANLLKKLSLKRQVICVTHQPLVAAVADHHLCVIKSVKNGKTCSSVRILNTIQDRQKQLAELAGGDFAEANAYAASLLGQEAA